MKKLINLCLDTKAIENLNFLKDAASIPLQDALLKVIETILKNESEIEKLEWSENKENIVTRIDTPILKKIKALAKKKNYSLSGLINHYLTKE